MTTITLDKQRVCRFTQRTVRLFEAENAKSTGGLDSISKLIFYSLLADDPELKIERLEDMIDATNVGAVLAAATLESEAFANALKPATAGADPNENTSVN